jgi:hypothetical protein
LAIGVLGAGAVRIARLLELRCRAIHRLSQALLADRLFRLVADRTTGGERYGERRA